MRRLVSALSLVAMFVSAVPAHASHPDETVRLSGTVVADDTDTPLEGVCVDAMSDEDYDWTQTHADGTYELTVSPGAYRILFTGCEASDYLGEWFDDAATYEDATVVDTGDSTEVVADARLTRGGTISGTIVGTDDVPAQTCITALSSEGYYVRDAWSEGDGTYVLSGLPLAETVVQFGCSSNSGPIVVGTVEYTPRSQSGSGVQDHPENFGYVTEYYDDSPTFENATAIAVGVEPITNIDAVLELAGAISGIVSDDAGRGIGGVCVSVWDTGNQWFGDAWTWDGWFSIGGLPTGAYIVAFDDCEWPARYKSEYYDDAATVSAATPITVTAPNSVEISAVLANLPRPDIAVTNLSVSSVPLRTDAATLPGTGLSRTVDVQIENLGTRAGEYTLWVYATSKTDRSRTQIALYDMPLLKPGQSAVRSYDWDARVLGDVTITATVCSSDDMDPSNDTAKARSYGIVGGTGLGLTPPSTSIPPDWDCSDWR